ncbi:hypothetical protein CRG98_007848 [Punica granatum]|uniref:Uncharacterized protein n=1 Tax=Punica granatum TaxID=22663 RepID=A0A2I0KTB1_PUNGR|nr:hypothetical protein CRG98_007848 [Punica granatum]
MQHCMMIGYEQKRFTIPIGYCLLYRIVVASDSHTVTPADVHMPFATPLRLSCMLQAHRYHHQNCRVYLYECTPPSPPPYNFLPLYLDLVKRIIDYVSVAGAGNVVWCKKLPFMMDRAMMTLFLGPGFIPLTASDGLTRYGIFRFIGHMNDYDGLGAGGFDSEVEVASSLAMGDDCLGGPNSILLRKKYGHPSRPRTLQSMNMFTSPRD